MSNTSFVMPNDLSDLCRVCLQLPEESQYLDLTTIYDEEDNLTYGECFTICTKIDLSAGEGVPHHLCKSCGIELQMSYDFYKKVEESKRVIQQCQRQIEEQKMNIGDILSSSVQQNKSSCDMQQQESDVVLIDKYVVRDCEDEVISTQGQSVMKHDQEFMPVADIHGSSEMDITSKLHQEINSQQTAVECVKETIRLESSDRSNAEADLEEHLEIDYQNLETLEDEETETIQMKCGENIIPIQIKYNTNDFEENEEYVEYAEDDEVEIEGNEVVEKEEEEEEEDYGNYQDEPNVGDKGANLTWKENVVAVANKEHIPIEIENYDEMYETSDSKKNEIETVINENLQDNVVEDGDDVSNKKDFKKKQKTNKCNITRKRHVGSYACDYCQRVYPNYSRMMSHRRCHEADRPKFTCSYCGRMYATKQAMECHIQTAHEKSGYTCSICNKVFAIRKSLEIHVRYHTGDFPYACNLCDRKFAQACHLNTHINVKHNKIRFSCEYPNCGKFFTSSTSLRNHEFTHGIMPFECEYCQRGYPAKAKLRIHIKRKHGIDLNIDQLENMRKFHVMRSKVNLVQFVET